METTTQTPNKHRLVFGLGSGLIYSLGPNWKELVPKLLNSFDNDVLVSTIDMAFTILNTIIFILKCVPNQPYKSFLYEDL
jgi:hypothetical protein